MGLINNYRIPVKGFSPVKVNYTLETAKDTEDITISFSKQNLIRSDRSFLEKIEIYSDGIPAGAARKKGGDYFIEPDFNDYELTINVTGGFVHENNLPVVIQKYDSNSNSITINIKGAHANTRYIDLNIIISAPGYR